MGVKNLWKIVKPFGKQTVPTGKKIAVDASIWIKQIENAQQKSEFISKKENALRIFLKRTIKLLYNKIEPIFVFDGSTPALKMETIRKRQEAIRIKEEKKLIKDILTNKICSICNKRYKECEHGSEIRKELMDQLDAEVFRLIENHEYDWGERSTEDDSEEEITNVSEQTDDDPGKKKKFDLTEDPYRQDAYNPDEDFYDMDKLSSKKQMLQRLNRMRENRKQPMPLNNNSDFDFIQSQLANVKSRSMISTLIRDLNDNQRVMSDSNIYAKLTKEEKPKEEPKHLGFTSNSATNKSSTTRAFDEFTDFLRECNGEADDNEEIKASSKQINQGPAKTKHSHGIKEYLEKKYTNTDENSLETASVATRERTELEKLLIEILNSLSIRYVFSPGESDGQCIGLFKDGIVEGVITEDNDILVGGATVYKNFFYRQKLVREYTHGSILEGLSLNQEQLFLMSLFLGSDYCDGVEGIGPVKSMKLLNANDTEELIEAYKIDKVLYKQISKMYKEPTYVKIKPFVNGEVNQKSPEQLMNKYELENASEFIYHLKKLDRFEK